MHLHYKLCQALPCICDMPVDSCMACMLSPSRVVKQNKSIFAGLARLSLGTRGRRGPPAVERAAVRVAAAQRACGWGGAVGCPERQHLRTLFPSTSLLAEEARHPNYKTGLGSSSRMAAWPSARDMGSRMNASTWGGAHPHVITLLGGWLSCCARAAMRARCQRHVQDACPKQSRACRGMLIAAAACAHITGMHRNSTPAQ